jgi:hypothetical protein
MPKVTLKPMAIPKFKDVLMVFFLLRALLADCRLCFAVPPSPEPQSEPEFNE